MPYEPGVQFIGGQLLGQGIMHAADSFAEAMKRREELQKQGAFNDAIVGHALQSGRITQDDWNKYQEMSWTKKQGYANGLAANIADDWARQKFAADQQDRAQQLALSQRRVDLEAAQQNFVPSAQDQSSAAAAGGQLLPIGQGRYAFAEYPDNSKADPNAPANLTAEEKAAADKAGKIPLRTSPHSFTYADMPEAESTSDPSKWRQVTIPQSGLTVIVDDKGKIIPNSKLQGILHPSAQQQMVDKILNPGGGGGAASTAAAPVTVTSKADYDNLPSGAVFIAPDGTTRRKP